MKKRTKPNRKPRLSLSRQAAPRSTDELGARLQSATGERVSVKQADWLKLMQEGVLVQLHIRRWRAQVQIALADLGLPEPKDAETKSVYDELMSLGTKKLLPAAKIAKLNSLDSGARKLVDASAYKTYWGNFVIVGAYRELRAKLAKIEQAYLALGAEIADNLDANKQEIARLYAIAAREGYRRLKRLNPKALVLEGNGTIGEDDFVKAFVERVLDAIPTADYIRQSFGFEVELSYVPLPALLARDTAEKDRIAAQRARETRREQIESGALDKRERELAQMNADIERETRSKKNELIARFASDLQTQLNALVYDGLVNVLESVGKNDGTLVGKAAGQVRSIIQQFKAMGEMVGDNAALERQIAQLETMMNAEKRSPLEIAGLIREIGAQSRANLLVLGSAPRSARHVGIPDRVEPLDLGRVARRGRSEQIQMDVE